MFVDSLALAFRDTVTARPIGLMVLQLDCDFVLVMAVQGTVFADPFHVAFLAGVKVCLLAVFPFVGVAVHVGLEGHSFDLHIFAHARSQLRRQLGRNPVDHEFPRNFPHHSQIHFRTNCVQMRENAPNGRSWRESDGAPMDFVSG